MNILATFRPYNTHYNGVIASLVGLGENLISWTPGIKPAFDVFDELRPDLFICTSEDFTPELVMALEVHKTRCIVFGPQYPDVIKPVLVCVPSSTSQTVVDRINTSVRVMDPAANTIQYINGIVNKKYASDVCYISNIPLSTNNTIVPTIQTLLNNNIHMKMCGDFPLPEKPLFFPQYLGKTSIKMATNMMVSSIIVIDFDQQITLDAAYNKVFCMTNTGDSLNTMFPSFETETIVETVQHYLGNKKHREAYIKQAHRFAKANTYMHRLAEITKAVPGLATITTKATEYIKKVENDY